MSDLWTITWKELRDAIFPGGKIEPLRPVVFIAMLGLIWPLITGQSWLTLSTAMVSLTAIFPFFFILNYVGDAFAGERERHTLETLLASRIPDQAILLGKVIANVGYIWGMSLVASLLGAVVVNLSGGQGPWRFYAPVGQWVGVMLLALLTCLFSTSAGILVSLHSATVRQAQQTLLLGSVVLWLGVYFVARAVPADLIQAMSLTQVAMIAMLTLALIDAVLLAISLASFRRSHLFLR